MNWSRLWKERRRGIIPFTREQKQQWYQANKSRLNQRKQELRKLKRLGQDSSGLDNLVGQDIFKGQDLNNLAEVKTGQDSAKVETLTKVETAQEVETNQSKQVETSKLWSSHYSVLKPWCYSCQQKGILETHYAFCSCEKIKDALSIRLPNRYICQVYHWTLFQGQGKIGGKM